MKDSGIADLLTPKDTPYSLPKDISPKAKPVKPQEEERFREESPASVRKIEKPPLISPDLPPDFTERYCLFLTVVIRGISLASSIFISAHKNIKRGTDGRNPDPAASKYPASFQMSGLTLVGRLLLSPFTCKITSESKYL